ncbi:MAG: toprim domain-containing protein [Parvibaculaceae bacterium]
MDVRLARCRVGQDGQGPAGLRPRGRSGRCACGYATTGCPCWASLGAERLATVSIPPEVGEIHLFSDRDEAGQRGAAKASDLHRRIGRTVVLHLPPLPHKDWGDVAAQPMSASAEVAA